MMKGAKSKNEKGRKPNLSSPTHEDYLRTPRNQVKKKKNKSPVKETQYFLNVSQIGQRRSKRKVGKKKKNSQKNLELLFD